MTTSREGHDPRIYGEHKLDLVFFVFFFKKEQAQLDGFENGYGTERYGGRGNHNQNTLYKTLK